tara:strand:- start:517 stop:882 length:366 start_codon:yes stop_codon:yes gene_type:complete
MIHVVTKAVESKRGYLPKEYETPLRKGNWEEPLQNLRAELHQATEHQQQNWTGEEGSELRLQHNFELREYLTVISKVARTFPRATPINPEDILERVTDAARPYTKQHEILRSIEYALIACK